MTYYIPKTPDAIGYIHFTNEEHATWKALYTRQIQTIIDRAAPEFIQGLETLNLCHSHIPSLEKVNRILTCTGWEVAPVTGTILVDEFFRMLGNRKFPAATFIRIPEEIDYLQQPDIFHEIFGHCPMLTNQAYADFLEWYANFALTVTKAQRGILGRLFWYTIEFGLLETDAGLRIYGGGILSSHQETIFALAGKRPVRNPFDLDEILATPYRYDRIQEQYFILPSMDALYALMDAEKLKAALERIQAKQKKSFVIC